MERAKRQLKALYAMHALDGFAMSLIGIFIPIYLLKLGFSVAAVLIFFIEQYAVLALFAFVAIFLAQRFGLVRTIMMRLPFAICFFAALLWLPSYSWLIYIIPALQGIGSAFYWIPAHILFAKSAPPKELGNATGKLMALSQFAGLLGPLLGGFLAVTIGFANLILIVLGLLSLAVVPLAVTGAGSGNVGFDGQPFSFQLLSHPLRLINILTDQPLTVSFTFKLRRGFDLLKCYPKLFFAEIFDNIGEEVEAIIWPIIIYLNLKSVTSVGVAGTLVALGSIGFQLLAGRIADTKHERRLIKTGALLLTAVWTVRAFVDSAGAIFLATLIAGFVTALFLVPFTALVYKTARRDTVDEFFVFREVPVAIGRIIILLVALLFVDHLQLLLPIAGAAYLYFLFL